MARSNFIVALKVFAISLVTLACLIASFTAGFYYAQRQQTHTAGSHFYYFLDDSDDSDGSPKIKIFDITAAITPNLPVFNGTASGLGVFWKVKADFEVNTRYRLTQIDLNSHTGTHVDANSHFLQNNPQTVADLDIDVLLGPALVVDLQPYLSASTIISADLLDRLPKDLISKNASRFIFKTTSSHLNYLEDPNFHKDYSAFDESGVEWILNNTKARLVGIDYLSACTYNDIEKCHRKFFSRNVTLVEGLNLSGIDSGVYYMICLPIKVPLEGALARAILLRQDHNHNVQSTFHQEL